MKIFGYNISKVKAPRRVKATPAYPSAMMTRLNEDFPILILSADAAARMNLRELRARSQQLEREHGGIAERYLSCVEANVIGADGIQMQIKVKDSAGEFNADASKQIEDQWCEFNERGNFEVTAEHSGQNFDRLSLRSSARDGDALQLIYRGAPNKWKIGFQLLEGQYLDEFHNVGRLQNGNQIRMGVELDEYKRKVAFWVLSRHPGDYYEGSYIWDGRRMRVPAYGTEPGAPVHAIHLARTKRPEETRAVPWITPAMGSINMLAGYEEAELVGARAQACKHVFYERTAFAADGTPLEYDNQGTGQLTDEMEPGGTTELPIGYKANVYNPTHPNQAFPEFTKDFRRKIAAALNCSYNTLFTDLEGVNFSSIRAGLLDERESWKMTQTWYIDTAKKIQFAAWLEMQLLLGAFDGFGMPDFDDLRHAVVWKPRRWSWVDPLKDIQASTAAIEAKLTTRSRVISQHSNEDFEETIDELKQEQKYISDAGLDPALNEKPTLANPTFPTNPNPDDPGSQNQPVPGPQQNPKSAARPPKQPQKRDPFTGKFMKKAPLTYVIRHGCTSFNAEDCDRSAEERIRGHLDIPLSQKGREQAAESGEKLKDKGITHIFTSDLSRSADTAEIIASKMAGETRPWVIPLQGLRPWSLGPEIEGELSSQVQEKIQALVYHPDETPKGGESFNTFQGRFIRTFLHIQDDYADQNVAVVTHYRTVKYLRDSGGGKGALDTEQFLTKDDTIPPASVHEFDKTGLELNRQVDMKPTGKSAPSQIINIHVDAKAPNKRKFEIERADGTKITGSIF